MDLEGIMLSERRKRPIHLMASFICNFFFKSKANKKKQTLRNTELMVARGAGRGARVEKVKRNAVT